VADEIGTLVARVVADNEQFRADMLKMTRTLESNTSKMNSALARLTSNFGGMRTIIRHATSVLGAFGLALSVRGLVNFGREALQAGDAIDKASKTAGVGAETIQQLRFAFAQLAGTTDREVDESLRRFNRRIGLAAQGQGEALKTTEQMSIALRTQAGAIRSTDDVLEESLRKLADIESDSIRAARASQLFGEDAGPRLAAALGEGIDAMEALRQATPGVISDANVRLSAELADEFDRMARTVGGSLKNAFIEATARAGDFFGVVDLSEAARLMLEIEDIQARIRVNQSSGQFGSRGSPERIQQFINERTELERLLAVERARAAGVGGFATSSFLNGPPGGPDVTTDDEWQQALKNLIGEFSVLEDQAEQSADAAEKAWTSTLKNLIGEFDALEKERTQLARAADDEWEQTLQNLVSEFALLEEQGKRAEEAAEEMRERWDHFGDALGRGLEDSLATAFLGIETDFRDMLRRMAAQALASGILNAVGAAATGGVGKFFSFIGFGGAASSGLSKPSPSLASSPSLSGLSGFAKSTPVVIHQENTFNGSGDRGEIAREIEQSNMRLKAELSYESSRGRF